MKEAIEQFEQAIALDPELVSARYWLAIAHFHRGEIDEAIRVYRELLQVCPGVHGRLVPPRAWPPPQRATTTP